MEGQHDPRMIGSRKGVKYGKSLFTVYRVDIVGPRVDLVLCGRGQLIGSQKNTVCSVPSRPGGFWVNYRHFHKYLVCGEDCSVTSRPGLLAGRPGTLGSVSWVYFCSQLWGKVPYMLSRHPGWPGRPGIHGIPIFQNSAIFIFSQNLIKSSPDLYWSSPNIIHTSDIMISSQIGH